MIDHSYSKYSSLYGSGRSRGGARGAQAPPLFLDQTEARRAKKNFFEDHPPYLRVWMTGPPLSEGLDLPLYGAFQLNRCLSKYYVRKQIKWLKEHAFVINIFL